MILPWQQATRGFTLIELLVAIVALSFSALTLTLLVNQATLKSVDPMLQQQAYAISQSYMEEILTQPFCDPDDATCQAGCASATACTSCNSVEASRNLYDAVCDYHNLMNTAGAEDPDGNGLVGLEDYNITVTVDDNNETLDGLLSSAGQVVRIDVRVTHDNIASIDFTLQAYKTNF